MHGSNGNGHSSAVSFQDMLQQLGHLHAKEVEGIRQDYEQALNALRRENDALKGSLTKAGVSPEDVVLETADSSARNGGKQHASAASALADAAATAAEAAARAQRASIELPHRQGSSDLNGINGTGGNGMSTVQSFSSEMGKLMLRESIRDTMLIDGEFRIKEGWNKVIEGRHWGSNLDAFMVTFGTGGQGSDNRLIGKALVSVAATSPGVNVAEHPALRDKELLDTGCTIYPNSSFRLTWDLCGLLLISYDLITIPLTLAFMPTATWFSMTMDWTTLLFWTADMCQGFFLGYFEKGHYVSNNRRILKHYLLTWFIPDVIVVGPEWLVTVASSSLMGADADSVGEIGKIMKGARAVRALRLLRLLKLQRIINLLYDMIESEHTFIVVNLGKLLVAVLVLNHVIACLWYLIGRVCMENSITNWIQVGNIEHDSSEYKYLSALHWSLTQFTPASMDISARNIWERMFSIVVLFFAMVAFSSIVASITGSMTSLRNMKQEDMKQFWLLRRYLRQRSVTPELSNRIFKYLEFETQKQSKLLQRKSIVVLQHLSTALQSELTHALNSPFLIGHPFFGHLDNHMSVVMHRLCHICLKPQSHAEREVIFSAGEKANQMFFIKGGQLLEYTSVDGMKLEPPPAKGEWVAEAVLFTDWRHQGELHSVSTTDLLGVDPTLFIEVMCVHPRPWFYAKRYATKFIKFINGLESHMVIDILRDEVFYDTAVSDCDKIGMPSSADSQDDGADSQCENSDFSDSSPPGDYRGKNADESDGNSGGFSSLSAWKSGGRAVHPARRSLGLCPCGGGMPCEPWHGPSSSQKRGT